jgi:DNA-binding NarL/FixJ family response regulator
VNFLWSSNVPSQTSKAPAPAPEDTTRRFADEPRSFRHLDITERQLEVLYWVQEGKSASDIGGILGLSHRTVEHHLEKVCHHLGVRTRVQAMLKARDMGLIPIPGGQRSLPPEGSPTRF